MQHRTDRALVPHYSLVSCRPFDHWMSCDDVEHYPDEYMTIQVWAGPTGSRRIMYPKALLQDMGTDTMPHYDVFRRVEGCTAAERQSFWLNEGAVHLTRFAQNERHRCHLLFVMWHDFQQLSSESQAACKPKYIENTYSCLDHGRNSTRLLRQMQAFAHYVCDGGDVYIEPNKFIDCDNEVVYSRVLFKKMVNQVLADVVDSEQQRKRAAASLNDNRQQKPSQRVMLNHNKQRLPKLLTVSIGLCQTVGIAVLKEHPVIISVLSAKVIDSLPSYTVQCKQRDEETASQSTYHSYDMLAVHMNNLEILRAFHDTWRSEVRWVANQMDPTTKALTLTVTWKDGQVNVVSQRFFEVVGWMELYDDVQRMSPEGSVGSMPETPGPRITAGCIRLRPFLSSTSTTKQKALKRFFSLLHSAIEQASSEAELDALSSRVVQALSYVPTVPAAAAETVRDLRDGVSGDGNEEDEEDADMSINTEAEREE
jgi:hypothetical protein